MYSTQWHPQFNQPVSGYNPAIGAQERMDALMAPRRAQQAAQQARQQERRDRNMAAGEKRYDGSREAIDNIINQGYIDQAQADKAAGRYNEVLGDSRQQQDFLRKLQEQGLLNPEEYQDFMDQMALANSSVENIGENGGVDQSNYDFATGNMRDSIGSLNEVRDNGMFRQNEFDDILSNTYGQIADSGKAAAAQFFNTPGGSGILGPAGAASVLTKTGVEAGKGRANAFAGLTEKQAQSRWDAANDSVGAGKSLGDLALGYGEGQREGARISADLAGTMSDFLLGHGQGRIQGAELMDSLLKAKGGWAGELAGIDMSTMPAWLQQYLQEKVNDEQGAEGQMNQGSGWKDKRTVKKSPTNDLDFSGYGPTRGPMPMGGGSPSPLQGPSATGGSGGMMMNPTAPAPQRPGANPGMSMTLPQTGGSAPMMGGTGSMPASGPVAAPIKPSGGMTMMNPPQPKRARPGRTIQSYGAVA